MTEQKKIQAVKNKRLEGDRLEVRFMPRDHALRFLEKALVKHRRLLDLLKDK